MNWIRPALIFGAVLLVSVGWLGSGLWLALDGSRRLNHFEVLVGTILVFPSSIFVPIILTWLINRFVSADREIERGRPNIFRPVLLMLVYSGGFALLRKFVPSSTHGHVQSPTTIFWLIFGSIVFVLLLAYSYGRRVRTTAAQPARSPLQARIRIRKLERDLKNLRFMRRRPEVVFVFLVVALVVLIGAICAPSRLSTAQSIAAIHAFGWSFGLVYIVFFALFLHKWLSRRWETYLNFYIHQTEDRLSQAKSLEGQPPA